MKLKEARKIINQYCRHHEEWHCGSADIYVSGRDENPRFNRRVEIYLDLKPYRADIKKISRLLKLLDQLGKPIILSFRNKLKVKLKNTSRYKK